MAYGVVIVNAGRATARVLEQSPIPIEVGTGYESVQSCVSGCEVILVAGRGVQSACT
jgi:hypothetical protein